METYRQDHLLRHQANRGLDTTATRRSADLVDSSTNHHCPTCNRPFKRLDLLQRHEKRNVCSVDDASRVKRDQSEDESDSDATTSYDRKPSKSSIAAPSMPPPLERIRSHSQSQSQPHGDLDPFDFHAGPTTWATDQAASRPLLPSPKTEQALISALEYLPPQPSSITHSHVSSSLSPNDPLSGAVGFAGINFDVTPLQDWFAVQESDPLAFLNDPELLGFGQPNKEPWETEVHDAFVPPFFDTWLSNGVDLRWTTLSPTRISESNARDAVYGTGTIVTDSVVLKLQQEYPVSCSDIRFRSRLMSRLSTLPSPFCQKRCHCIGPTSHRPSPSFIAGPSKSMWLHLH